MLYCYVQRFVYSFAMREFNRHLYFQFMAFVIGLNCVFYRRSVPFFFSFEQHSWSLVCLLKCISKTTQYWFLLLNNISKSICHAHLVIGCFGWEWSKFNSIFILGVTNLRTHWILNVELVQLPAPHFIEVLSVGMVQIDLPILLCDSWFFAWAEISKCNNCLRMNFENMAKILLCPHSDCVSIFHRRRKKIVLQPSMGSFLVCSS